MKPLALISCFEPEGIERIAAALLDVGFDLLASDESATPIAAAGLAVTRIAEFTDEHEDFGFPPTLHPRIEAALTGTAGPRIELVFVRPYPAGIGNDVGGRTLLMLAVKGERVAASTTEQMRDVLDELASEGRVSDALRVRLATEVCVEAAGHFAAQAPSGGVRRVVFADFAEELSEGENPYQRPARRYATASDDPLALTRFVRRSGQPPCFTNLADADAILHTAGLLAAACRRNLDAVPALCIAAKHGNACGIGVSWDDPAEAIERALWGAPQAIWGGEVATNFAIDAHLARRLHGSDARQARCGGAHWMLDLVLAPDFDDAAVAVLGQRPMRKLMANPALRAPTPSSAEHWRMIRGGWLSQPAADYVLDLAATGKASAALTPSQVLALCIAWAAAFGSSLGGNEIAIARDGALLAAGGGPSTVEAARSALDRCAARGHDCRGAAFAADAFFPFDDVPAMLGEAGVTAGCAPTGSVNDATVAASLAERGVAMVWLPPEIRGFCRH